MKRFTSALYFLVAVFLLSLAARAQETNGPPLPRDVYPDSRNRLPLINGSPGSLQGAAAIRLHGSQGTVRWQSPVGRDLTELAILTAAREHDQPYEWSLHEMEATAVGLNPAVIDIVRYRKPLTGAGQKELAIIQIGREVFGTHKLSSATYADALKLFGERDLVDIVDLMAGYAATAARLNAVNQQMPPGWKQFLPLPFTPPDDMALAILVTARAHDAQYEWTMNEPRAIKDGLEPAIIDQVRYRKSVAELAEKDTALIQFGRELFGKHSVTSQTYARALKAFGERDLVDIIDLMAQHTADGVLLTVFDQRLPAAQKPLLPIP